VNHWEIEHARQTGVSPAFLHDRSTALMNYWIKLYGKRTERKHTKPREYYEALKGRVEGAFLTLKKPPFGMDVDKLFFNQGKFGLNV
jgi:hypothetical protein